jgi:hypothetical protein
MSKLVRVSDKTYELIMQMKHKDQSIGSFINIHIGALENYITYQYFMELKPYQQDKIRKLIFKVQLDSKLKLNSSKLDE